MTTGRARARERGKPMFAILCIWSVLNGFELLLCGADKFYAKTGRWRIPEKVLLGLGLVGGSLGLAVGMILFHHKVSKPAFRFGVPAMVLVHTALALAFGHMLG